MSSIIGCHVYVCRANRDAFLRSAAGQYLVQFSDLSFKQQIGDGSVGRVHLGKWQVPACHSVGNRQENMQMAAENVQPRSQSW